MKYLLLIVCYTAMLLPLSAQKRISINGIDLIDSKKLFKSSSSGVVNGVPAYCINFFANNKKIEYSRGMINTHTSQIPQILIDCDPGADDFFARMCGQPGRAIRRTKAAIFA